ncbi:hypothetical protein GGX14DRAFT_398186 [Mycena pura]|uniref:Myb/SANT-like domain-containing protein n=1 Tax=Mycena pura TaxID=153505 RepID=A0AAD6V6X7_9AGAR|nr:hypothetical protein GGX14DRAFT_398186 [Mycena pura]
MATKKIHWSAVQTTAALNVLLANKSMHQSGNGWKPDVWTQVVKACKDKVKSVRLASIEVWTSLMMSQIKANYEDYLFVGKFSGTGWDDEAKHFTNVTIVVEEFLEIHGQKYKKCFNKACAFYDLLDQLYDGAKSKATGSNVVHLGATTNKARGATSTMARDGAVEIVASGGAVAKKAMRRGRALKQKPSATQDANKENLENPIDDALDVSGPLTDVVDLPSSDDELILSPKRKHGRVCAESDDDTTDASQVKRCRRSKPDTSSSGKRNADTGFALSTSFNKLPEALTQTQTVMTAADVSHVDDVIKILDDNPTLLPPDPDGELYDIVARSLSKDPTEARRFIATVNEVRRKRIVLNVLKGSGFDVLHRFEPSLPLYHINAFPASVLSRILFHTQLFSNTSMYNSAIRYAVFIPNLRAPEQAHGAEGSCALQPPRQPSVPAARTTSLGVIPALEIVA